MAFACLLKSMRKDVVQADVQSLSKCLSDLKVEFIQGWAALFPIFFVSSPIESFGALENGNHPFSCMIYV